MKKIALPILIMLSVIFLKAQTIDVKKNIISIDGQECLKLDKSDPNNVSIADLNGNDLVYLKFNRDKYGALYNTVIFLSTKQSFTSKRFIYTAKLLVKRMAEFHLLEDCKINPAKLDNFIMKCDENVQLN